jgi:hypothetical protein
MGSKHHDEKAPEPAETESSGGFASNAAHAVSGVGSGLRDAAASGVHDVADLAHDAGERVRAAAERGGHAASDAKDAVTGKALALRTRRRKLGAAGAAVAVAALGLLARLIARRSRD